MAFRRIRLIAPCLVAAGVTGFGMAATAENWTITPQLSDQEEFTDNVLLTPTEQRSDVITTLSPSIAFSGSSTRLQGTFDYSPTLYLYALTPGENLIGQNLYANGTATIVPDTFFIDTQGYMSLLPSTPGLTTGALGPNQSLPTTGFGAFAPQGIPKAELTQVMSFSASPYLVHRFDGFGTGELRYTLGDTILNGGTAAISGAALPSTIDLSNEATASFLTGENFGRLVSRVTLDDLQSTGTGVFSDASQATEVIDFGLRHHPPDCPPGDDRPRGSQLQRKSADAYR